MCKSVPDGYGAAPLLPHEYPLWIKAFAGVIAIMVLASLSSVPKSLGAAKQLRQADYMLFKGELEKAVDTYELVLAKYPDSEAARLHEAEALFQIAGKRGNKKPVDKAMKLLVGVSIPNSDFERLAQAMPEAYVDEFERDGKYAVKLRERMAHDQSTEEK